MITTQKEVRKQFWQELQSANPNGGRCYGPIGHYSHNNYPTDIRVWFCDFIDRLQRSGDISEALAQRATL